MVHQLGRVPFFTQWVKAANPNNGIKILGNQHFITLEPLAQTWHVQMW
jgi:hypothetical protein